MKIRSHIVTLLLTSVASLAHAGPPVAQLFCATGANYLQSESAVNLNAPNPPALKFKLSYFDLGVGNTSNSNPGSGASSEKTTLQPFVMHAALARFVDLYGAVAAGGTFSQCSLETTATSGDILIFTLNSVRFESIDAIASSTTQSAFTAATLTYSGIAIQTVQTGVDNGGTSAPPN